MPALPINVRQPGTRIRTVTNRSPRRSLKNLLPMVGLLAAITALPVEQAQAQAQTQGAAKRDAAPRKPAVASPARPAVAAPRKAAAPATAPRKAAAPAAGRQAAARSGNRVRTTIPAHGRAVSKAVQVPAARATPVSIRQRPDTPRTAEAPSDLVLRSTAVLVASQATGQTLFSRNDDKVRSIAPMDELITITEEDIDATRRLGSRLAAGTTLSRAEMLRLSLMSSENRATAALARTSPGGTREFIAQMNIKAQALGMQNSRFEDSTGLHNGNVATAQDLVRLVTAGMQYTTIREYSTTSGVLVDTPGNRAAHVQFNNSNQLVASPEWEIGLSKTGFIREAGRCLVMQTRINGEDMVIVLLDSDGRFSRIGDANRIRRWVESGFSLRLI
jgi:D-alanyl-D-alanine endopeptidase (penicillin-binding protein 7)